MGLEEAISFYKEIKSKKEIWGGGGGEVGAGEDGGGEWEARVSEFIY